MTNVIFIILTMYQVILPNLCSLFQVLKSKVYRRKKLILWHFLCFYSPSGCTFWGKKPWSRKKKILWQLGILVGAPVGIALIAGIAVPAIIIGA